MTIHSVVIKETVTMEQALLSNDETVLSVSEQERIPVEVAKDLARRVPQLMKVVVARRAIWRKVRAATSYARRRSNLKSTD